MVNLLDPLEPLSENVCWIKTISGRPEKFVSLDPLPKYFKNKLPSLGIKELYTHQLKCYQLLTQSNDVIITTPSASGKSLAYQLPIINQLQEDESSTALFLFPTKALARDQAKKLLSLLQEIGIDEAVNIYDGDTPKKSRKPLRGKGRLLFTNPDMLHVSILPNHQWWSEFFTGLKFLVVDELHTYNGIFGSHFANVMRRLETITEHYKTRYKICVTSATISNPEEHARRIFNRNFKLIEDSGAYEPKRYLVGIHPGSELYLSYVGRMIRHYLEYGIHLLTFVRSKRECELLLNITRRELEEANINPELVASYRSGYTDEERRSIERRFNNKEIEGIIATSALELGIDIGHLQVVILVGFPRSIASFWQQIGRAGRKGGSAAAIFVAKRNPIDQFLLRHPDYLFKPPEHAAIDPENPEIKKAHKRCLNYELPHKQSQNLNMLIKSGGRSPSCTIDLRSGSGKVILKENNRVVGQLEKKIAPLFLYPGAVYLHQGETYLVKRLNLEANWALLKKEALEYFTEPMTETRITVKDNLARAKQSSLDTVQLKMKLCGYRKISFDNLDLMEQVPLDFEIKGYQTKALSIRCKNNRGLLYPLLQVAGLFVLSLPGQDLMGGYLDSGVFLYDAYPGGVGISKELFKNLAQLTNAAYQLVNECPCPDGCPSCTGRSGDKKVIVNNLKMLKVKYA